MRPSCCWKILGPGRSSLSRSLQKSCMVHSPHLLSRQEVGRWLASRSVPVLEFRAAVIVGSGSASFEMIRHLVERLPVRLVPNAINTLCQPIGVRAMLEYLVEELDHPDARGIFEIGGTDVLTYREMMLRFQLSASDSEAKLLCILQRSQG